MKIALNEKCLFRERSKFRIARHDVTDSIKRRTFPHACKTIQGRLLSVGVGTGQILVIELRRCHDAGWMLLCEYAFMVIQKRYL